MKTTTEHFKKLLPTLQHLARFPGCNHAAICTRNGVQLAEVMAVITETCGAMSLWDEDYLGKVARELRVAVPAYQPGAPRSAPVSGVSVKPVTAGGTKLGEGKSAAAVMERPAAEPKAVARPTAETREVVADGRCGLRPIKPKLLAVLRALLADRNLTENQAVQRCGIRGGSWSYFKSTRLGLGPIDLAKARALLEGAAQAAAEPVAVLEPAAKRVAAAAPARAEAKPGEGEIACSVIAQLNELVAVYRVEIVSVRLVPAGVRGGAR